MNNIQDPDLDNISKKSSQLMLQKYIDTLGRIAYKQEEKKNFPDGLPPFSVGTAPIYDKDIKNEIFRQKQFAKYGGRIFRMAGIFGDDNDNCPCGVNPDGSCKPCGKGDKDKVQPFIKDAKKVTEIPSDYSVVYEDEEGKLAAKKVDGSLPPIKVPKNVVRTNLSNYDYLKKLATSPNAKSFEQYVLEGAISSDPSSLKKFRDLWVNEFKGKVDDNLYQKYFTHDFVYVPNK